jgi:membrane-bound metal-dependent hydrolase YbcI (DUF457 family)
MWPWGHLAVAYLAARSERAIRGRRLTGAAVLALAVGALAPDLIDKPLAWGLSVLPSGRSLAHSLFAVGAVGLGVAALEAGSRPRRLGTWFAGGYLSHVLADAVPTLLTGQRAALWFLNWPLGPHPPVSEDAGVVTYLGDLQTEFALLAAGRFGALGWIGVEFGVAVLVGVVWDADGAPGAATVRALLSGAGRP